jgi:hypothetical protein
VPIAELTGYLPSPWYLLAQIATPWLVASFWAGYLCRRAIAGATAGTAVIIVGLISHVAFKSIAYGSSSVRPLLDVIVYWTILGVCLGSAMGVAGVLSHSDLTWIRAYAWALPSAVAAVEAVAIAMGLLSYGVKIAGVVGVSASLMFVIGAARSNVERVAVAGISLVVCGLALFAVVQRVLPLF